jgi:hypothetical protein
MRFIFYEENIPLLNTGKTIEPMSGKAEIDRSVIHRFKMNVIRQSVSPNINVQSNEMNHNEL